ncbi:MAG TPA: 6-phosphofructokinase [Saprospiraceae bacterium]|nr:6-phosphofructokinase [Saprospiraceae bacterium]HRK81980.1 6-phosphofructokinase [Saprospiraceae bacterium]
MKHIAVFTSGGDSPGMNACIRAVVRTALHAGIEKVSGIYRGYQGMIENDFMDMNAGSVSNIIQTGGTILRSARSDAFRTPEGRRQAYENLKAKGIEGIVAIGGDGTFTGANIFMKEYPDLAIVGCPGTIDNDLYGTDYTIGYDTAINTAMAAIDNIKDTANAHGRLFFVEVMGRDAGFIALMSGLATGAEDILVPEFPTDMDKLVKDLEDGFTNKKNSSIVVVAEGDDVGGAFHVAAEVKKRLVTPVEIKVTVLGHVQRGGRPTCMERVRASRMGMEAVNALLAGKRGVMIGEVNHEISFTPFEQAIKHNFEIDPGIMEMIRVLA